MNLPILTPRRIKITVLGSAAVTLVTFVCDRTHVSLASAIPAYMLLIVMQSTAGDFYSAALISLFSAICLDFFFTEPRFSLYISNPAQIIALIVFIFTALVITRLVSRERAQAKSSALQKDRLNRLYKLSQELLALEPDKIMTEKFLEPYRRLFGVTAICAFDADTAQSYSVGDSDHNLENKTREAFIGGHDFSDPVAYIFVRCLRVSGSGKMTGAIGFKGLQDPQETTGSLAALSAVLVQRSRAFHEASAAEAAAQAELYRSAVLDALAHEFKTPLTTILAAAGAIREAGPLGPEQNEMADTVENEAVRLSALTSRLLRTARLDSEEIKPKFEWVDVGSMAAVIADQYSSRSPDRHFRFADSRESARVLADPELLRIALNQLVENACKYSVPDSTVSIEIEQEQERLAIKVCNDGSSIPFKERERIFERFYRGSSAARSTSGSGLGLYVARKIAIAHGGALDLENQERSKGRVTFCLRIPMRKEAPQRVLTAQ